MSYDPKNPYASPNQSDSPFGGGAPDPNALARVQGPATGLIVTAVLGMVGCIFGAVMNLVNMGAPAPDLPPDAPPQMAQMFKMISTMSGPLGVVQSIVGIGLAVVILLGALKLKNLQSYGFAMTAAIIALVPCISPCCLVGLPVGIWALVVMNDASVKAAFR